MSTPYETETWRQPTVQDGDTVVFSEHGRSVNHVDFKSHWLMLVKAHYGGYWLCVKHGGGEERISIGYHHTATGLLALSALEADARYLVLIPSIQPIPTPRARRARPRPIVISSRS